MGSDWREASIESIATKIAMGPFGSDIKAENFVSSGVPVIRGGNLTSGRFRGEDFVFLTEEKANELMNANAYPGDLVFTHRGTLGQVGLLPNKPYARYVVSQSQMKLTCDKEQAIPEYIYYYFKSPIGQNALLMNTSQTGVPAISRPVTSLKAIRLHVPPPPEQRVIARILGTFDDKIELNRQISETLGTLAKTFFKSWFVDFDGIAQEDMRESEMGLIPKGWDFLPLVEVTSYLNRGLSPKYIESDGVLVLNQKCIRNNFVDFTKARRHDHALKKINGRELQIGDVLVNSTGVGTLGRVAQILHLPESAIVDSHVTVVRAASTVTSNFLGLNLIGRQEQIEAMGEGSTGQTELSRVKLGQFRIIVPPLEVIKQFDQITQPLRNRSSLILLENDSLASIRDLLLPKLISGQLRIKEAEKFLESHI
jgi:type I restriction enzyme S subunit